MVADVAFMADLDRQIASVMDCNPLLEDEVIRLCEKVRETTYFRHIFIQHLPA
jgi:hypothetical protein